MSRSFAVGDRVLVLQQCRSRSLVGKMGSVLAVDRQIRLRLDEGGEERLINKNELALCSTSAASATSTVTPQLMPGSESAGRARSSLTVPITAASGISDEAALTPSPYSEARISRSPRDAKDLEMQLEQDSVHVFTELAAGGRLPTSVSDRLYELASQASPKQNKDIDFPPGPDCATQKAIATTEHETSKHASMSGKTIASCKEPLDTAASKISIDHQNDNVAACAADTADGSRGAGDMSGSAASTASTGAVNCTQVSPEMASTLVATSPAPSSAGSCVSSMARAPVPLGVPRCSTSGTRRSSDGSTPRVSRSGSRKRESTGGTPILSREQALAEVYKALRLAEKEVSGEGTLDVADGDCIASFEAPPPPRKIFRPLTRPMPCGGPRAGARRPQPSGVALRCRMLPAGSVPDDDATANAHTNPLIGVALARAGSDGSASSYSSVPLGIGRSSSRAGSGSIAISPTHCKSPTLALARPNSAGLSREELDELARKWSMCRKQRDYATADEIRAQIRACGREPEELAEAIQLEEASTTTVSDGIRRRSSTSASPVDVDWTLAHELGASWLAARRLRDYVTADAIRTQIRTMGIEPEDVISEGTGRAMGGHKASHDGADAPASKEGAQVEAAPIHVNEGVELTPHLHEQHHLISRRAVTGKLLTHDYQKVEELPPEYGFSVVSQKWGMSIEAAAALKAERDAKEARSRMKQPEFRNPLCPPPTSGAGSTTETQSLLDNSHKEWPAP